jgi:hypothetical protein
MPPLSAFQTTMWTHPRHGSAASMPPSPSTRWRGPSQTFIGRYPSCRQHWSTPSDCSVTILTLLLTRAATPKLLHGILHHIYTGSAAPVFACPWQLDPEKNSFAKEEFLTLKQASIIRRSNLQLVPKEDCLWFPCGTTATSMQLQCPSGTPNPTCSPLMTAWRAAPFFSKIDLVKGYHQIPIAEADITKQRLPPPLVSGNFSSWLLALETLPRP